jgi:hypothetical protein
MRPLSCRPVYNRAMISFVYSLDHGATSQQEEMIRAGLEARFPASVLSSMPRCSGVMKTQFCRLPAKRTRPSPTGCVLAPIPKGLANEVRETFRELVREVALVRPS